MADAKRRLASNVEGDFFLAYPVNAHDRYM